MQKLKNSILARMIQEKSTSKEIDFLLYVSCYQDENGKTCGVHYKAVSEEMQMSHQAFYDAKKVLEEKKFIYSEKTDRTDHDITILDNKSENCVREGYINTNHNLFFCETFRKLKSGAKLLAMELMKITYAGKGYFEIGVRKFYQTYPERFQVSKRVMRGYLMQLKEFFYVGIKSGKYYIEPKKNVYRKHNAKSEADRFRQYGKETILRRNRINDTEGKAKELEIFFKQYTAAAVDAGKDIFRIIDGAVKRSLEVINGNEKEIKRRFLSPALVHKLLREELYSLKTRKESTQIGDEDGTETDSGSKNTFFHFHQREYDYDELERLLIKGSKQLS